MATVLKKKPTKDSSNRELTAAILKLATDKNHRILMDDEIEWLETKLAEIARITRILRSRWKGVEFVENDGPF